ncbi:MAG: ABC transporter ATP-binding protein [Planctomycetota bacterium]
MIEPPNGEPSLSLEAEGIRKSFAGTPALRGVSLSVRAGEWLGLLGPNGAGKTTLMRVIAGLLPADEGEVSLLGRRVDAVRTAEERDVIGLVPQELALYPTLTAEENLRAFARFHGVAGGMARERVDWALGWTGLAERARERVATFSGGMKRRLNIACAVLHGPRVLLLDEPTVGVDPQARQRIWSMLGALREEGVAIVHSSHQLDEVEATCDRVVILDRGEPRRVGAVADLLRDLRGSHRISMRFDATPTVAFGPSFEVDGATVTGALEDPARDLPELLAKASESGLSLLELKIEAPRLEDLFTALTGEGLRE